MTNFEKIKQMSVDDFSKLFTILQERAQRQAIEKINEEISEDYYTTTEEKDRMKDWRYIIFDFYKNWLESEADNEKV